jgi:hypothetical protein
MRLSDLGCTAMVAASVAANNAAPLKLDFEVHRKGSAAIAKRDGSVEMELGNAAFMYLTTLKIGLNKQEILVQVDTGSSDLWVMAHDVDCLVAPQDPFAKREFAPTVVKRDNDTVDIGTSLTNTCLYYGSFETGESTLFKRNLTEPFELQYGDKSGAMGVWGSDTVVVGNVLLSLQRFGVANMSLSSIGVLGIGLPLLESSYAPSSNRSYMYENMPLRLRREGYIARAAYLLYLNDIDQQTGLVLFGAVDHAKYLGPLLQLQIINTMRDQGLTKPGLLEVLVSGLGFNLLVEGDLFVILNNTYPALLDLGSTQLVMPQPLFDRFVEILGAKYSKKDDEWTAPCAGLHSDYNITINFSGAYINVPLLSFLVGLHDKCVVTMAPNPDDFIVLADNALRSIYVVYDLEDYTISVANVRYTSELDVELILDSIPGAVKAPGYLLTLYPTSVAEQSATTKAIYKTEDPDVTTADVGTALPTQTQALSDSSKKSDLARALVSKIVLAAVSALTMLALI